MTTRTAMLRGMSRDAPPDPFDSDRASDRLSIDTHALLQRLKASSGSLAAARGLVAATVGFWQGRRHGDLPRWQAALDSLPALEIIATRLDGPTVRAVTRRPAAIDAIALATGLRALMPWRKGPFRIADLVIDSEWRSDRKWGRLAGHIAPLDGRRVLDVGCGNGYYLWRMRGAGAAGVTGIDPSPLALVQQRAIARYLRDPGILQLPTDDSALDGLEPAFDTVFSMGVLYHHRRPETHLARLRRVLLPGGELVLETLVWPSGAPPGAPPDGRYAGMRNVHWLDTAEACTAMLERHGFRNARIVDESVTSSAEQRRTAWMPWRSLDAALEDGGQRTVEGLPAPRRAVILADR